MGERHRAEPADNIDNRLRQLRTAKGLSQVELAASAGITRQAVSAIEATQYLPTTAVALRLAGALQCRVEDLFSLVASGDVIEGELVGASHLSAKDLPRMRVKVTHVGDELVVRPVSLLGEVLTYAVPADGLVIGPMSGGRRGLAGGQRVKVRLLRDRREIEREIAVAGCDPAIFLAGEYLRRRHDGASLVGWTAGSAAAVDALKRGEVHMAGVHVVDWKSGESNLPYLRRHLKGERFTVVTFATWEAGLLVRNGNPKSIRSVDALARRDVTLVNREEGAGARMLLDQQLAEVGLKSGQVKGYGHTVRSHFAVARALADGQADVGVGVRSAAQVFGLGFIPLQQERYDLVTPTALLSAHPALSQLLETIVTRSFRTEIEALGGYDTRETGTVRDLRS